MFTNLTFCLNVVSSSKSLFVSHFAITKCTNDIVLTYNVYTRRANNTLPRIGLMLRTDARPTAHPPRPLTDGVGDLLIPCHNSLKHSQNSPP